MNSKLNILRHTIFTSLFPVCIFYSSFGHAGADIYCEPSTILQNNEYTACNNLPALTPANDNQTNLLLLLSDLNLVSISTTTEKRSLWDTNYSDVPFETKQLTSSAQNKSSNARKFVATDIDPYQEHCNSMTKGSSDFIQQVKNDRTIPSAEKDILIRERNKISECEKQISLINVNPNWTMTTRQYASYLNATIAFYNTNFSTATKIYSLLTNVNNPWLKETAQYMLIRSNLNAAFQSGVGEYGDLQREKLNQTLLKKLFNSITQYLKLYPNGEYAASARGLLRRGYWLNGRHDLLVNEFVWQINNPKSKFYNLEMNNVAYEIDRHVFQNSNFNVQNLKDPLFLAIYDLMQMRKPETADDKVITWTQLNSQKETFKNQPELFQYLQANHLFFIQNKPQEALNLLPKDNPSAINNYLQLSQIFLKGRIIEKLEKSQSTQHYWESFLAKAKTADQRGLFELTLYPYYLKQQNVDAFIGSNAKIKQASLQKSFISESANENSLMKIIQTTTSTEHKNLALYTALNKSLVHQNYNLFNQAYAALPSNVSQFNHTENAAEKFRSQPPLANFIWKGTTITPQIKCSDLKTLTQKLADTPKDVNLRLCLGEYFRSENGYMLSAFTYSEKESPTFQGSIFTRGQVYKEIIKTQPNGELKAYALYRAIQCYAPSGSNDCQDQEVEKSVRKQWFDQIKRDYPNTTWAKSLKFYW
ncbi:MAG: hypothetical protein RR966_03670 [Acinetobacter sp.]